MSATYKSSHYESIDKVHRKHFWFRARNLLLQTVIGKYIPQPKGKSFLEIGFGTGIVLEQLEMMGFITTGLDVNQKALEYARKNVRATLIRQSIFSYKPKMKFDAVGAFDVAEHLNEDEEFFSTCFRLLKPGGNLFISVPASMKLWSRVDELSDHKRRYEKDELEKKICVAGFQVKLLSFWQTFTLLPYLLWRQTMRSRKDIISTYVKVPFVFTNEVLYWLLRAERPFVTRMGFPYGGSLILVAHKPLT